MNALPLRQGVEPEPRGVTTRPPHALLRAPDSGGYSRLPAPAVVVYRLDTGGHQQTGIVVEVAVDDYRQGRIRRHEATRPDHAHRVAELTETSGTEQLPVMLVHRGRTELAERLAGITADAPDVSLTTDGVAHSVWVRPAADHPHEIAGIDALYIADGHHRMSAAVRYADRRAHLGGRHPSAFTLAALFPAEQMRILGHDRRFRLRAEVSAQDVVDRLRAHSLTARIEPRDNADTAPGEVAVGVRGRWYRISLRSKDEMSRCNAAIDDGLVPALHDLLDHDSPGPADLRLVPHPPTIEQVMAISDTGLVLPPKSTWFHPKPLPGLFLRELR